MRHFALLLFVITAAAAPPSNSSDWKHDGARFVFSQPDGSTEVQWLNDSTFRVVRRWVDSQPANGMPMKNVNLTVEDSGASVEIGSKYIKVRLARPDFRLTVRKADGALLMEETAAPVRVAEGVQLSAAAQAGERFYGLGPRSDADLSARGKKIETGHPLLISTAGYGLFHTMPGRYEFDLADRVRTRALATTLVEYYFYYGPTPKDILEQHGLVRPLPMDAFPESAVLQPEKLPRYGFLIPAAREFTWKSLAESLRRMLHASMSGILVPAWQFEPPADTPEPLFRRGLQLASVSPLLAGSVALREADAGRMALWRELLGSRNRLFPYLATYLQEAWDRGLPVIHPLPMQFPNDDEAPRWSDQFMLGDELLVAPMIEEGNSRSVYLPMGIWTDLGTNEEHRGRRTIQIRVPDDSLPIFARNGSIVPFAPVRAGGPMEVHYFPNLGGEFFLTEPETWEVSQLHAGPAGDYMRLEVESKSSRFYEWVVHHRGPAREVVSAGVPFDEVKDRASLRSGSWYYDPLRHNLHVYMDGPAGEDRIVNIRF